MRSVSLCNTATARIRAACAMGVLSCAGLIAGTVGAPDLGFLFDPAIGAVRPISGIPGAAVVGDGVFQARHAAIAPGQRFGLIAGEENSLGIWNPDAREDARLRTIEGTVYPDRIVFSPDGKAAVLVRDQAVQVLTGLPDSPAIRSLPSAPEPARTFAVTGEGDVLAGGDSVWLLRENESPRQVPVSGPVSALAFWRSDALVAGANQIVLVRNLAGASEYRLLATYEEGRQPVAVQFSPDATRALTVTAGGEVSVFTLEGERLAQLDCRCRPSGLHRLAGSALFRLNEIGNGPTWLVDAADQPRLWFVPRPLAWEGAWEGSAQ